MNLRRTDLIVDRRGWDAAEYAEAWRRGRCEWLLRESPKRLDEASRVRLVVDGDGSTFSVRAIGGGL